MVNGGMHLKPVYSPKPFGGAQLGQRAIAPIASVVGSLPAGRAFLVRGDCILECFPSFLFMPLTISRYVCYNTTMRRKQGALVPFEQSIIRAAIQLRSQGVGEFHGFQIAKEIGDTRGTRFLTGYGTLYRALGRLEQMGLLKSRWEETLPAEQHRPRRRYYRLTDHLSP